MPRTKRVVAVGVPHHVTQRGNARQDVFLNDDLCCAYLELLAEHAQRNRLRILAYCLMTNHVHPVVVPETERSLANTFRHAHSRFAQYWNTGFHRNGHMWQNRLLLLPGRGIQGLARDPLCRAKPGTRRNDRDGGGVLMVECGRPRRRRNVAWAGLRLVEGCTSDLRDAIGQRPGPGDAPKSLRSVR
jgi:REP element-mobilizing transposase RayT